MAAVVRVPPGMGGPETAEGGNLTAEYDPLVAPPPKEVPLRDAPLVRVIAQVRFSPILSVQQPEFIAPFQEAIRAAYPVLRKEHAQSLLVGPQGIATGQKQVAWRLADVEGAWRVSLAPEFVALETTDYSSRSDFIGRMQAVLGAVAKHIEPAVVQRVGLRYIDRVTGDALEDIAKLVRPEMLGIVNTPLYEHARHELSETLLSVPDTGEQLLARWGHLPAGGTVDPNAIEPIHERSWVLDIDMFSAEQQPLAAASLIEDLGRFAERLYTVFRWTVTEEFLRRYGGEP